MEVLFNGILSQLRSIPVGLGVDSWILEDYPDLAPLQREAVMKQLEDKIGATEGEKLFQRTSWAVGIFRI